MFSITHKLQQLNTFELAFLCVCFSAIQMPVIGKYLAPVALVACEVYGTVKAVIR